MVKRAGGAVNWAAGEGSACTPSTRDAAVRLGSAAATSHLLNPSYLLSCVGERVRFQQMPCIVCKILGDSLLFLIACSYVFVSVCISFNNISIVFNDLLRNVSMEIHNTHSVV